MAEAEKAKDIFPEWESYMTRMLKHVRFRLDRAAIREEYQEHMEDLCEILVESGMDAESAKLEVLRQMGDADANGEGLNMVHHPVIGWVWWIARALMIVVLVLVIGSLGYSAWKTVSENIGEYERLSDYWNIMAEYEMDELVKVGDVTLYFDNVVRYQSPDNLEHHYVNINYISIPHVFSKTPVIASEFWAESVTDEKGTDLSEDVTIYSNWYKVWNQETGIGSSVLWQRTAYGLNTAKIYNFPPDSDVVIIDYQKNDVEFYMEIPVTPVNELTGPVPAGEEAVQ